MFSITVITRSICSMVFKLCSPTNNFFSTISWTINILECFLISMHNCCVKHRFLKRTIFSLMECFRPILYFIIKPCHICNLFRQVRHFIPVLSANTYFRSISLFFIPATELVSLREFFRSAFRFNVNIDIIFI